MIHDFKASEKEKRGRLLLLNFFLFYLEEEKFMKPSLTSPLFKNRIRYSVKKIVKSKKRLKYEKFFSKRHLKMKARNASTYRRTDAQEQEQAIWVS